MVVGVRKSHEQQFGLLDLNDLLIPEIGHKAKVRTTGLNTSNYFLLVGLFVINAVEENVLLEIHHKSVKLHTINNLNFIQLLEGYYFPLSALDHLKNLLLLLSFLGP